MSFSIGIDLGTSSMKAVAIDEKGNIICKSKGYYDIYRPEIDWAEQKSIEWQETLISTLRNLVRQLEDINNENQITISSIGVAGQMHGLVTVDTDGNVLYPPIIWADNRTNSEVEFIKSKLDQNQKEKLANPIVNSFTAPKLLWLKNNKAEIWRKIDKFMLPKDYIVYLLTGKIITDKSDASATLLFDIEKNEWAKDIIESLGLSLDIFPEIVEPATKVSLIKGKLYNDLDLHGAKPEIISVGGDAPVTAFASGVIKPGQAAISLGTAGQIIMPTDRFISHPKRKIHTLHYALKSTWHLMGAILSAGYNMSWWLKKVCGNNDKLYLDSIQEELSLLGPGSDGLLYLPYIQGERSPINNPDAAGVLFGLKSDHTNVNIISAMMEGVAFALKSNYNEIKEFGLEVNEIYLTGGGAKSKVWGQTFADIFNQPVYIVEQKYDTSYGAALLALEAINLIQDARNIVASNIHEYEKILPDDNNVKKYEELYTIYSELYQDNKEKMKKLSNF